MVELDQFKYTLSTYVPMLKELGASLNLDAKKEENCRAFTLYGSS